MINCDCTEGAAPGGKPTGCRWCSPQIAGMKFLRLPTQTRVGSFCLHILTP